MRRPKQPLFEQTKDTVFNRLDDWSRLVQRLSDVSLKPRETINIAVVGSQQDLPELIQEKGKPYHAKRLKTSKCFDLFRFQRTLRDRTERTLSGEFLVVKSSYEYVSLLVLIAEPIVWKLGLLPFIESLYPGAVRPFLTQPEMQKLLKGIQTKLLPRNKRVRVQELSTKKRLIERARKRFESDRKWTDADLDQVFREAKEQNSWFRSITFELVKEHEGRLISAGARATLSKYGYFKCDGEFDFFSEVLINDLLRFSSERIRFFSRRDRVSSPTHEPRPLQITYDREIFKSPTEAKKLVKSMQRFKHGTCTVLHANPYVHLSLVDNIDYSSADVWVLSQNEILVMPQMRASHAALKRIVNHIFEDYREGSISEFQEQN